ncbi:DUF167 domain-containing protein [Rhodobacterales bacterium HKCCE2091]|nr:DUF167 domain-containing protein [Rhodobacterales bacterium HKCCE2091]
MAKGLPDLSHLVSPGVTLTLRVTPRASANSVDAPVDSGAPVRLKVTAPAEGGKANAAVLALLAKALGVPKSRLTLVRGATSRDKLVRID